MSSRPTRNHVCTCFRACSGFGLLALTALAAALTLAPSPAAAQPGAVRVLIHRGLAKRPEERSGPAFWKVSCRTLS